MKPATDSKSQSYFPAPQVGRTWLFVLIVIWVMTAIPLVLLPDHTRTLTLIAFGAPTTSLPNESAKTGDRDRTSVLLTDSSRASSADGPSHSPTP